MDRQNDMNFVELSNSTDEQVLSSGGDLAGRLCFFPFEQGDEAFSHGTQVNQKLVHRHVAF